MSFTLSTGNVVVASSSASIVSQTDTTATIRVTVSGYITDGWVYSTGVGAHITINGSTTTRTLFGNGVGYYYAYEGTKTAYYDVTVNKTTASQSISWTSELYQYTDGNKGPLKQTDSGTITVNAKTSYPVTYNANGGTGAPAAQTKYYGTALTLSSTKPTRTGYTFSKWNTNASGTGTNYNSGASYTANAALTLYAIWTANTYTISYNANGGTGAPSSQTKTYGVNLTLSNTKPTRTNYNFVGWSTSSTAATAEYSAGGVFTTNAATTLYAVWELAYTVPTITSYSVSRCTSNGTLDDFGTYVKVIFNWSCSQLTGTNNVSAISIGYRVSGTSSYSNTSVSASGTSGSVSKVIGGGNISTDSSYDIQISVTDTLKSSNSGTSTRVIQVPMAQFIMDFKAGGTGIAIGKPATLDDTFEVAKKTIFTDTVSVGDTNGLNVVLDSNEILAKNGTSSSQLDIQSNGGRTVVGGALEITGRTVPVGGVFMRNNTQIYGTSTDGNLRSLAVIDPNNYSMYGYGGYSNNEGRSYFDGNEVHIRSKGHIYLTSPSSDLTSRAYGVNNILWSGVSTLMASHTCTFSQAVSAQPNGIVLVWSSYSNSTANDSGFAHMFIPKSVVATHPNKSIYQVMGALGAGCIGSKVMFISDTSMYGHDNNGLSSTDCSITYNNKFWVLRYVIGV